MTLALSVVPTILVNGAGAMVKGRAFSSTRVVGNPVQQARVYTNVRDVDELVLLDVCATIDGRGPSLDLIRRVSETCFVPLVYGGGIRTVEEASACIEAGAERVVVSTNAIDSDLIERIADRFGCNAVTAAVDRLGMYVAFCSGRSLSSMDAPEWASLAVKRGAGEILLQSITRDGTMTGYDLDAIREVRAAVPSVRLIASGGCSGYEDMALAFVHGADAVAAGALWSFTDATPAGARAYLAQRGYPVRPMTRPLEVA